MMERFDLPAYLRRSRALDLSGIAWDEVPRHPLPEFADVQLLEAWLARAGESPPAGAIPVTPEPAPA